MSFLDASSDFPTPRLLWAQRTRDLPIPRDETHFKVTEKYIGCRSLYARALLSSPNALTPSAILVSEQVDKEEGDLIWFTRVYSTVPSMRSEPTTASFQFPGMVSGFGNDGTKIYLRNPITLATLGKVVYEYFLTSDPFGEINPSNAIPIIHQFVPFIVGPPSTTSPDIWDAFGPLPGTDPTLSLYSAWVSSKEWICAKDSEITNYAGNIWERKTIYVVAR